MASDGFIRKQPIRLITDTAAIFSSLKQE